MIEPTSTRRPPDIVRALADATVQLTAAGVTSPRHDAATLAAFALGIERGELSLWQEVPPGFAAAFAELIERRSKREPLQHITGESHFRHVTLQVGPGVFIPRPETELTAEAAIQEAQLLADAGRQPLVVDLFAGSGAIALSVVGEVPFAVVHAVEASGDAVTWLRRNVADGPVIVHHRDALAFVPDGMAGQVDVVVANPPYVPTAATIRDREAAEHDPAEALWSGADGLDAMRGLERVAAQLLRVGGLVVAEHADVQGESAPDIFRRAGQWTDVEDHVDLNDRPRYITARRSGGS